MSGGLQIGHGSGHISRRGARRGRLRRPGPWRRPRRARPRAPIAGRGSGRSRRSQGWRSGGRSLCSTVVARHVVDDHHPAVARRVRAGQIGLDVVALTRGEGDRPRFHPVAHRRAFRRGSVPSGLVGGRHRPACRVATRRGNPIWCRGRPRGLRQPLGSSSISASTSTSTRQRGSRSPATTTMVAAGRDAPKASAMCRADLLLRPRRGTDTSACGPRDRLPLRAHPGPPGRSRSTAVLGAWGRRDRIRPARSGRFPTRARVPRPERRG